MSSPAIRVSQEARRGWTVISSAIAPAYDAGSIPAVGSGPALTPTAAPDPALDAQHDSSAPARTPYDGDVTPTRPAPARGRPRSTTSHQAVLQAVAHLIDVEQLGFEQLTIEGIAAQAGVGKQTIYRWWPDKAAIVMEAIQAGKLALDIGEVPDTGDLTADLRMWMRQARQRVFTEKNMALARSLIVALVASGVTVEEYVPGGSIQEGSQLAQRLESEERAGRLREGIDVEAAAFALLDPVVMKMIAGQVPEPNWFDALVDVIVDGVRR